MKIEWQPNDTACQLLDMLDVYNSFAANFAKIWQVSSICRSHLLIIVQ